MMRKGFTKFLLLSMVSVGFSAPVEAGFEFVPAVGDGSASPAVRTIQPIKPFVENKAQPVSATVLPSVSAPVPQPLINNTHRAQPVISPSAPVVPAAPVTLAPNPAPLPLEAAPLNIYSEAEVFGDAYSDGVNYPRRTKPSAKKKSLFSINPWPFGKESKKQKPQSSVLFGRPVPTRPDGPAPSINEGYVADAGFAVSSARVSASSSPEARGNYDEAIGFGDNMPLPIALSQIVPDNYAFSYEPGVDLGQNASWQGGKPWNVVMDETLAPLDLHASIDGMTVTVKRGSKGYVEPSVPARVAAPSALTSYGQAAQTQRYAEPSAGFANLQVTPGVANAYAQLASFQGNSYADTIRLWTAPRGASLRQILQSWSKQAGVNLFWTAEYDYPIQTEINLRGTYQEAIQTLLLGLSEAQPRPTARLHPNLPEGPAVLVVRTRHIIR